ncbi:MAG: ribbon-helix-helix protein, CopG family [Acidobacteria bacterium]|nr:ribbon-helix-helix protein, CopG family [Acidobacteriota bacterium]
MNDRRRARLAQYAERINRALGLLRRCPPAAVLRTLARRYRVSPRQARRYVDAAQQHPQGVPVPEPTVVFTVKLPASLARRLRALARATGVSLSSLVTRGLEEWLHRVRPGPGGGG